MKYASCLLLLVALCHVVGAQLPAGLTLAISSKFFKD